MALEQAFPDLLTSPNLQQSFRSQLQLPGNDILDQYNVTIPDEKSRVSHVASYKILTQGDGFEDRIKGFKPPDIAGSVPLAAANAVIWSALLCYEPVSPHDVLRVTGLEQSLNNAKHVSVVLASMALKSGFVVKVQRGLFGVDRNTKIVAAEEVELDGHRVPFWDLSQEEQDTYQSSYHFFSQSGLADDHQIKQVIRRAAHDVSRAGDRYSVEHTTNVLLTGLGQLPEELTDLQKRVLGIVLVEPVATDRIAQILRRTGMLTTQIEIDGKQESERVDDVIVEESIHQINTLLAACKHGMRVETFRKPKGQQERPGGKVMARIVGL